MVTNGSSPSRDALPWPFGVLAVLAGLLTMALAVQLRLPVRAFLPTAEALLVVPGLILLGLFGVPLRRGLAWRSLPAMGIVLAIAAGACLWSLGLGLMQVQNVFWQPPEGYLDTFRQLHDALRPKGPIDEIVSVLAIAVAPGVCEELLFRGIVLPSFLRWLGEWGAVVAAAILFGVIHLDQGAHGAHVYYRIPFAIAVGLGLGVLRVKTGTLVAPVLAHATLNTITFEAARLLDTGAEEQPAPVLGVVMLLVGLVGFVGLLGRLRRQASGPPSLIHSRS